MLAVLVELKKLFALRFLRTPFCKIGFIFMATDYAPSEFSLECEKDFLQPVHQIPARRVQLYKNEPPKERPVFKNRAGRPRRIFNPVVFERLAFSGCSYDEIAAYFGCHQDTVRRLVKHEPYQAIWQSALAGGRAIVRSKQLELAQQGDVKMLIWLGKQYLGQRDEKTFVLSKEVLNDEIKRIEDQLAKFPTAGRTDGEGTSRTPDTVEDAAFTVVDEGKT